MEPGTKLTPQEFGQDLQRLLDDHAIAHARAARCIDKSVRTLDRYLAGETQINVANVIALEALVRVDGNPVSVRYADVDWSLRSQTAVPDDGEPIWISDEREAPAQPVSPAEPDHSESGSERAGDDSKAPKPSERVARRGLWLFVGSVAVLIAVTVAVIVGVKNHDHGLSQSAPVAAAFTSPVDGASVPFPTLGPVQGTITGLGHRYLWLVQYKVNETGVHPFNQACTVTETTWTCGQAYLGNLKRDAGARFVLELVVANAEANTKLVRYGQRNKTAPNAYEGIALPPGATPIAQITVTRH